MIAFARDFRDLRGLAWSDPDWLTNSADESHSPNPTSVYIRSLSSPNFLLLHSPTRHHVYLPLAFYQRQPGVGFESEFINFFILLRDSSLFFISTIVVTMVERKIHEIFLHKLHVGRERI